MPRILIDLNHLAETSRLMQRVSEEYDVTSRALLAHRRIADLPPSLRYPLDVVLAGTGRRLRDLSSELSTDARELARRRNLLARAVTTSAIRGLSGSKVVSGAASNRLRGSALKPGNRHSVVQDGRSRRTPISFGGWNPITPTPNTGTRPITFGGWNPITPTPNTGTRPITFGGWNPLDTVVPAYDTIPDMLRYLPETRQDPGSTYIPGFLGTMPTIADADPSGASLLLIGNYNLTWTP